jgi:hypothetical protein
MSYSVVRLEEETVRCGFAWCISNAQRISTMVKVSQNLKQNMEMRIKKNLPNGTTNTFLDTSAYASSKLCDFSCVKITDPLVVTTLDNRRAADSKGCISVVDVDGVVGLSHRSRRIRTSTSPVPWFERLSIIGVVVVYIIIIVNNGTSSIGLL